MPGIPNLPFNRMEIRPGDRICVAISGGADSVALLRALHLANTVEKSTLGIGLAAVHIHHGIRGGEADADQAFVQQLCADLDVPLHLHQADVPAHAASSGETLEEAARTVRYQTFGDLLRSGEADAVLTAHTLDDQTETVLLKLLRGAWTEGLGGIHPLVIVPIPGRPSARILRPFLTVRRQEIEDFLHVLNQPWREDSSNADPVFTRNRLRHQLLPELRSFNPSLDQALSNLAELARDEEAHWQSELARLLPQLLLPGKPTRGGGRSVSTSPGEESLALEIERLRPFDTATRRRILRAAARRLGARISFDETSRLLALCGLLAIPTVSAKAGASLRLSAGLLAERSPRELRLTRSPAGSR